MKYDVSLYQPAGQCLFIKCWI